MTFEEFHTLVAEVLGHDRRPNQAQTRCLAAGTEAPLLIVAGPGSGKTSVLVLRALRHVLVDRIAPERVLMTTFTIKAAKEVRTRLLEVGERLVDRLRGPMRARLRPDFAAFLDTVDVNRCVTGTLDSLCQEALRDQREPGQRRFAVVEGFTADVILARFGRVQAERNGVAELDAYLSRYTLFGEPPRNLGDAVRIVRTVVDRFVQDGVDVEAYAAADGPFCDARQAIKRIHDGYVAHLRDQHRLDFSLLERTFLERVVDGRTPDALAGIEAVLVDEYQDTNPLQERLYLELAARTGAALTVVGDDDQSLYRFRGATIELFRNFVPRARDVLGKSPIGPLYLVDNYRSSPEIVGFYNGFVTADPDFGPARVRPPKPQIVPTRPSQNMPVLGLFRDDAGQLAAALGEFLAQVFRGPGRAADALLPEAIQAAAGHGDLGDAVLLGSTVAEFASGGRERLPSLLRAELDARGVQCFNPRGRALRDVPEVSRLLGLALSCLEPGPSALSVDGVAGQMRLTNEAAATMRRWRAVAAELVGSNPQPVRGRRLAEVLDRWRAFSTRGAGTASEWPLLDVLYSFVPWLPGFRDDPEGQVYLEAISRCAAQAGTFSAYRGLLLREDAHREASVRVAVRDVFAPLAENLVEVDEEIMPSVPRDRLNIMTIHQAKGLEFPLVIVDVASDFKTNNHRQKFRRFPERPSAASQMEDDLAAHTAIGPLRLQREAMQRTFEDIIRLNYVAFSRPQSLLMLVGCRSNLRVNKPVRNVGTWWRRDGTWAWHDASRPPTSTLANEIPITLI